MFKRIDHIEIVTDQPEQTASFYTDVLGFTLERRERVDLPGGAAVNLTYVDLGGTVAELVSFEGVPVDPAPPLEHLGYRMIALEVEDMQKTADYLKGKGVKKYRALNQVGAGIGQSSETLRTWEKEFLKDEDCAYELWFSEVAGQYETELDGSQSYVILDEFGLEPYYRNTSLSTYARSVLTAIRKYALSDVQEKLRESRLGSGE